MPTTAHDAEFLPFPSLPPSSSSAFASAGQRFVQPCTSSSLAYVARKPTLGPPQLDQANRVSKSFSENRYHEQRSN
ncbi:unnamed protein product [Sphagnum jensenii]|uniref:Uncharacterized protein n=1 Tax=Sphagnum jensenii TaxID=128206 RepID=A0ABP1AVI3_9BRYO